MTYVFTHMYLPLFVVDAEDHVKASALLSEYIKENRENLDMKVADLCTYNVYTVEGGVFCRRIS